MVKVFLFYIDSKIMPRHHGQMIRKFHLQHKKLVKVFNIKPNKKFKKIKNQKYYIKCLSSPSDVRDLAKHGL